MAKHGWRADAFGFRQFLRRSMVTPLKVTQTDLAETYQVSLSVIASELSGRALARQLDAWRGRPPHETNACEKTRRTASRVSGAHKRTDADDYPAGSEAKVESRGCRSSANWHMRHVSDASV
jgi:hypothetical protein